MLTSYYYAFSLMTVGHSGMSRDQIVENILKTVEQLSKKFPGGTDNVRCLYVKTTSSTSLPFFLSLGKFSSLCLLLLFSKGTKPISTKVGTVPWVNGKQGKSQYFWAHDIYAWLKASLVEVCANHHASLKGEIVL